MRLLRLPLLLFTVIFAIITTTGVFAAWHYATSFAYGDNENANISIIEFKYNPEEVLPSDKEDTELHLNHYNLINSIVNHIDYGLNANKKPIIRNLLLDEHGVVYGNQSVSGGNLKHMLLNTSDVNALMFVVEYVSDTEFNAYTFIEREASSSNVGNYIQVYKTIIVKESTWKAMLSYEGRAKVFRPGVVSYSIDVTTWESFQYPKVGVV